MNLKDYRKSIEKNLNETLTVVKNDDGYKTVHVVLEDKNGKYILCRYFTISGDWNHSFDVQNSILPVCLDRITREFEHLVPEN